MNQKYAHTPIQNDPLKGSNTLGTLCFALETFSVRATVLFLNLGNNSNLDAKGYVPFATIVGAASLETARHIHNPTPNSTQGVSPQAYADNGNGWIERTYPGINFILAITLQDGGRRGSGLRGFAEP